jgi:hypothetical protein
VRTETRQRSDCDRSREGRSRAVDRSEQHTHLHWIWSQNRTVKLQLSLLVPHFLLLAEKGLKCFTHIDAFGLGKLTLFRSCSFSFTFCSETRSSAGGCAVPNDQLHETARNCTKLHEASRNLFRLKGLCYLSTNCSWHLPDGFLLCKSSSESKRRLISNDADPTCFGRSGQLDCWLRHSLRGLRQTP